MRILHTGDWHLGKYLDTYSRLEEQKKFIDELVEISELHQIQLIIIAGDIYDTMNPPAHAEQLFYQSLQRLSQNGNRLILIIAGNHDSPDRLMACAPLLLQLGVIIIGLPDTILPPGSYHGFQIIESKECFVKLKKDGETVEIIALPYLNEKRLNEILSWDFSETERQKNYSEKICSVFNRLSQSYDPQSIHIAVGHFYISGGDESSSERKIQIGGVYAVNADALPEKAQYIAMGHLHRPQKISCACPNAYYAGSPIQYSKSECHYAKCVYIAELHPGEEASVEKIYLHNYKPIEIWRAKGLQEALNLCEKHQNEDSWVYLEIETDTVLLQSDIKSLRALKNDIIEIFPILTENQEEMSKEESAAEKDMIEELQEFYIANRKVAPSNEILKRFIELCGDGDLN